MKAELYSATGNILWLLESSDLSAANFMDYAQMAQSLCQSVRADGLMLMNSNTLELWIINKDGSSGGFCGNGICAFAYHVAKTRHLNQADFSMAGVAIHASMQDSRVNLALTPTISTIQTQNLGQSILGYKVNVPNPHLVVINPPSEWNIKEQGAALCIKYNSNIEFVYPEEKNFEVLVYERGVGVTAACGSGAIAVFKVLQSQGFAKNEICIKMPGGELTVKETQGQIQLSGLVRFLKSETGLCI